MTLRAAHLRQHVVTSFDSSTSCVHRLFHVFTVFSRLMSPPASDLLVLFCWKYFICRDFRTPRECPLKQSHFCTQPDTFATIFILPVSGRNSADLVESTAEFHDEGTDIARSFISILNRSSSLCPANKSGRLSQQTAQVRRRFPSAFMSWASVRRRHAISRRFSTIDEISGRFFTLERLIQFDHVWST